MECAHEDTADGIRIISTLVTGAETVKARKGMLALCAARANGLSALQRTNLQDIIPMCATLAEARARVTTPARL